MGYQTTVYQFQSSGVVGELYDNSPVICNSYVLDSEDEANNVIGRAFTVTGNQLAQAGNPDDDAVFAGILVGPKQYASFGSVGQPLAPTLTLSNGTPADILSMGAVWVVLPATANIGDWVIYEGATGELNTIAPGDAIPSGSYFANATVQIFDVTQIGLAMIRIMAVPAPSV